MGSHGSKGYRALDDSSSGLCTAKHGLDFVSHGARVKTGINKS